MATPTDDLAGLALRTAAPTCTSGLDRRHAHTSIQTRSGRMFDLVAPRPEDVDIEDIAHALSNICRFTGHTREFYSVAQHCVLASYLVPRRDALWALLHDAAEAYLADVATPAKRLLRDYASLEAGVMRVVCVAFGLPLEKPASVQRADATLLAWEAASLMPPHSWHSQVSGADYGDIMTRKPIEPVEPSEARIMFRARFRDFFDGGAGVQGWADRVGE